MDRGPDWTPLAGESDGFPGGKVHAWTGIGHFSKA
jgi:hypothetical protein